MRTFVVAFLLAMLVSALLTPLVRHFALRLGAVSVPGGRHIHVRAIPRFGGLAIFAAFFAPLTGLFLVESSVASAFRAEPRRVAALVIGGFAMCALGFLDDTRRVRALYKLYAHIAVAILAWACGFRIDSISVPLLGELSMGIFALPVTVLWIVGIINAINLIDGLDGLAAGVVFFAALTNFVVANVSGSAFVALLMASMLGAVVGFLFYNFNPARIFMGDSGSYFLGFVLAATSLVGSSQKASTTVSLLVPILALGVPIFDTLFAMVRRFLEKRPLFSPDRGHIHHRLLDMGLTHRRSVLILYGLSIVFTASAIGVSLGRSWHAGLAMLAASVVVVGLVRFVGYFEYLHQLRRQKTRLRSPDVERLRRVVPDVLRLFAEATTEDDVWLAMQTLMTRAEISWVEVIEPSDGNDSIAHRWVNKAAGDPASVEIVRARYPLGRDTLARASMKFAWHSDAGDVSAQSDVLLQVVVDVVARELARLRSRFAERMPAPSMHEDERTSSAESISAPHTPT